MRLIPLGWKFTLKPRWDPPAGGRSLQGPVQIRVLGGASVGAVLSKRSTPGGWSTQQGAGCSTVYWETECGSARPGCRGSSRGWRASCRVLWGLLARGSAVCSCTMMLRVCWRSLVAWLSLLMFRGGSGRAACCHGCSTPCLSSDSSRNCESSCQVLSVQAVPELFCVFLHRWFHCFLFRVRIPRMSFDGCLLVGLPTNLFSIQVVMMCFSWAVLDITE